jgi:hypothetical protein
MVSTGLKGVLFSRKARLKQEGMMSGKALSGKFSCVLVATTLLLMSTTTSRAAGCFQEISNSADSGELVIQIASNCNYPLKCTYSVTYPGGQDTFDVTFAANNINTNF